MDIGAWSPDAWSALGTWIGAAVALLGVVGAGVGVYFAAQQARSAKKSADEAKDARQMAIRQVNLAAEQAESARKQVSAAMDQAKSAWESARIAEQALAEQKEANRLVTAQLEAAERHRAEDQTEALAVAAQAAQDAANQVLAKVVVYGGLVDVHISNHSDIPIRDLRLTALTSTDPVGIGWDLVPYSGGRNPEQVAALATGDSHRFHANFRGMSPQLATYRFTDMRNQRWESTGSGDAVKVPHNDQT